MGKWPMALPGLQLTKFKPTKYGSSVDPPNVSPDGTEKRVVMDVFIGKKIAPG